MEKWNIKKQQKEQVNFIGNEIANKVTKISRSSPQLQLQINMIKKYLMKDISPQKKDIKLLVQFIINIIV